MRTAEITFLVLFIVFLIIGIYRQISLVKKIKIREYKSKAEKIVTCLGIVFLLVFGFIIGNHFLHYIVTLLVTALFWLKLYITGITEEEILYTSSGVGIAGLIPNIRSFSEVKGTEWKEKESYFVVQFKFDYNIAELRFTHDRQDDMIRLLKETK